MTRPARNSGPTIEWSEETATRTPGQSSWRAPQYTSQYTSQRGIDERNPFTSRRAETGKLPARAIVRLLDNSSDDDVEDSGASRVIAIRRGATGATSETSAALDSVEGPSSTLAPTIVPSGRPPLILARAKRRPSRGIAIARTLLIVLALYFVLSSSLQILGRPGLPLAPFPWASANGASVRIAACALDLWLERQKRISALGAIPAVRAQSAVVRAHG